MNTIRYFNLNCLLVFTIWLTAAPPQVTGITVKGKSLNCECYNPAFCEFKYCKLENPTRKISTISIYAYIKEVVNSVTLQIQLYKRDDEWKPFLSGIKTDGCKFMTTRRSQIPFVEVIWGVFEKHSNLNHSCPYNHDVIVEKLSLPTDIIPMGFPMGEYMMDTQWTANGKAVARVNASVEFS